jgi:arylsulfatase A-like enzyme
MFGEVIAALRACDLYDNTLILFCSDHGDFAGDYGLPEKTHSTLQDSLLRVPLIIKPPSGLTCQPGLRGHLTELVDISATVYDLLEIDPTYPCQGLSLRDSIAGQDAPIRETVFAEVGMRPGEMQFLNPQVDAMPPESFYPVQARATRPYHLAGSYAVMTRSRTHKYIRRVHPAGHELYDLREDPGERRNLYGTQAYSEVERELEHALLEHFVRTGDVLPFEHDSRAV